MDENSGVSQEFIEELVELMVPEEWNLEKGYVPFLLIPEDFTGFLHKYGGPPIEVVDEFFSAYYIDRQSILDGDISTEPILLPVKVDISPR